MDKKVIDVIKAWPEPKLVQNIQVFIGFDKFYRRFIQAVKKIGALPTSILKTSL